MGRQRIAVLRGGASNEYEVSLKTGAAILAGLVDSPYQPIDVLIDRKGVWHQRGIPVSPERALLGVDGVWVALHGEEGECGNIQRTLNRFGIPYVGGSPYATALCFNKEFSKEVVAREGIKVPRHTIISVSDTLEDDLREVFRTFPQPSVVKPVSSGSSFGISIAKTLPELIQAVTAAFQHAPRVIIEEYIQGKEATVGVVEGMRGKALYSLPPVEIIPSKECQFFDYEAKYNGKAEERCPGNFSRTETEELARLATLAHEALGLKHYSRTDFIVSPRGIYYLETNSAPACGMTEASLFPKSLAAVGISLPEFINHVLHRTLEGKR